MIDLIRKAVPPDRGYDDDAYMEALTKYGAASDEASVLHPVNYLTEDELSAVEKKYANEDEETSITDEVSPDKDGNILNNDNQ